MSKDRGFKQISKGRRRLPELRLLGGDSFFGVFKALREPRSLIRHQKLVDESGRTNMIKYLPLSDQLKLENIFQTSFQRVVHKPGSQDACHVDLFGITLISGVSGISSECS